MNRTLVHRIIGVLLTSLSLFIPAALGQPMFYGPQPYRAFNHTLPGSEVGVCPMSSMPFYYFYLDDYELGYPSAPGVTNSAGTVYGPGAQTDAVDADDGAIDGIGWGKALYANSTSMVFRFDASILGTLPTYAGIVLTDVGFYSGYRGKATLRAYGAGMDLLGSYGPIDFDGDNSDLGGTEEDLFFGVVDTNGLAAIELSMNTSDWECDHLQYGLLASVVSYTNAAITYLGTLSWRSVTDVYYQVQTTHDLISGYWDTQGVAIKSTNEIAHESGSMDLQQCFYRIAEIGTLDLATLPDAFARQYARMNIAGEFNGWSTTSTKMALVSNNLWAIEQYFSSGTHEIKFAANGRWLGPDWGDNNQLGTILPVSGTGEISGANIVFSISSPGLLHIQFDDITYQYLVEAPP